MGFKSGFTWAYLILAVLCLSIGIVGLLDNETNIYGFRDTFAWLVILSGAFSAVQVLIALLKTQNRK